MARQATTGVTVVLVGAIGIEIGIELGIGIGIGIGTGIRRGILCWTMGTVIIPIR
ncbi:uncharacterized protein M6B38_416035 [Iris pallida]|uniref:Uncharacterized protein n=1 Tax=Iris pallida TaxID=29817 RepID=A0AAX6FKS1_IRIPA|nr:uncharacterized protein M6B38_416035 [Iris pallida]